MILHEVGHIHRHLLDLRVVEGLNVLQRATVVNRHEVDCDALATEPTAATNPVNTWQLTGRGGPAG